MSWALYTRSTLCAYVRRNKTGGRGENEAKKKRRMRTKRREMCLRVEKYVNARIIFHYIRVIYLKQRESSYDVFEYSLTEETTFVSKGTKVYC